MDFCVGTVSRLPTKFTGVSSSNIQIFRRYSSLNLAKNHHLFELLYTFGITTKAFLNYFSKDFNLNDTVYVYTEYDEGQGMLQNETLTSEYGREEYYSAQSCVSILEKVKMLINDVRKQNVNGPNYTLKSLERMQDMLSSAIAHKHKYCLFIPS